MKQQILNGLYSFFYDENQVISLYEEEKNFYLGIEKWEGKYEQIFYVLYDFDDDCYSLISSS